MNIILFLKKPLLHHFLISFNLYKSYHTLKNIYDYKFLPQIR